MRFEESNDGSVHFLLIEPGEFVIKSLYDVSLVWHELVAASQAYPDMVPVFVVGDLRDDT